MFNQIVAPEERRLALAALELRSTSASGKRRVLFLYLTLVEFAAFLGG
jgi:hypothetical protein